MLDFTYFGFHLDFTRATMAYVKGLSLGLSGTIKPGARHSKARFGNRQPNMIGKSNFPSFQCSNGQQPSHSS